MSSRRLTPDNPAYWYSQSVMNQRAGKPRYDGMTDEQKGLALKVQRERAQVRRVRIAAENRPAPPPGMPPYPPLKVPT